MKNKRLLWVILAVVLVAALALGGLLYAMLRKGDRSDASETDSPSQSDGESTSDADGQASKNQAPDFLVYDREGREVRLSDFRGKPVVLNFWASWCGPCQREMPDFEEKYLALGEDVQFVMVNLTDGTNETVESASAFVEGKGYTFPVFYDEDSQAASAYGISSIPTTYFIDADGYLVARATGAIDGATLQDGIDMILP